MDSQRCLANSPATNVNFEALTEAQWTILATIIDTVIPSIDPDTSSSESKSLLISQISYDAALTDLEDLTKDDPEGRQVARAYLAERATTLPGLKAALHRLVAEYMNSEEKYGLILILNALNTRAGSLLLTGTTSSIATFSPEQRERLLLNWSNSYIPVLRSLYRSVTSLASVYWLRASPTLGKVLSYPKLPVNHNFGETFPFSFVQFPTAPDQHAEPEILETDVIIVGSGCSAAVTASILAQAGLSVIVTDKSYYWKPEHLPMSEADATANLFANGGIIISDDASISILSGSCWGGGGTVNWSASLQLQAYVRQEWAAHSGIPYFTSAAFQNDMDAVCSRMGVGTTHVEHNFTNERLLEGARKLGMNGKTVPQNTGGAAHNCGYCTLGCGSCGKKGPTESWLPDAAKHGARFIEGFQAHSVIYAAASNSDGTRTATGVSGIWTSRDSASGVSGPDRYRRHIRIHARHGVISACGALETPLFLTRSGITNRHVGRHLHLHPVSMLGAIYAHDVLPWNGSILTSVINDLERIAPSNHGVKLEATTMIPGFWLPVWPWRGGLDAKLFAAKMRRSTGYISLARDVGEGRVYADSADEMRVRVQYCAARTDRRHIAAGLEALAKIAFVEGAREIFVNVPGVPTFVRGSASSSDADSASEVATAEVEDKDVGVNDPAFRSWLKHFDRLKATGHSSDAAFGSAHQMGTARMGSSPATSVVDPKGRVWGTRGLYVVDTSLFPTSSGVNPMITCMALARGVARGIVKDLGKDGEVRSRL